MMVWPEGEYDFEVIGAELKKSKSSGKPMLAIKLKCFDGNATTFVSDWLVASNSPLPLMKLRHYCRSVGAMDAYDSGTLTEFPGVGAVGRLKLRVEDDPQYGAQNRVADYLPPADTPDGVPASQTIGAARRSHDDDEIPF